MTGLFEAQRRMWGSVRTPPSATDEISHFVLNFHNLKALSLKNTVPEYRTENANLTREPWSRENCGF